MKTPQRFSATFPCPHFMKWSAIIHSTIGPYGVSRTFGKSPICWFIFGPICFLLWMHDLRTFLIAPLAFTIQNCSLRSDSTSSTPECPFVSWMFRNHGIHSISRYRSLWYTTYTRDFTILHDWLGSSLRQGNYPSEQLPRSFSSLSLDHHTWCFYARWSPLGPSSLVTPLYTMQEFKQPGHSAQGMHPVGGLGDEVLNCRAGL